MKSKKKFRKAEYINAVMWYDGISRPAAKEKVKAAISGKVYGVLNNIVYSFRNHQKVMN
jgi:hypothetical protein